MAQPTNEEVLERVKFEELELAFPTIDYDIVWSIGCRIVDSARSGRLAIATAIKLGENVVFRAGRPGTSASNGVWVDRKIATVQHFDRASLGVGALFGIQGRDFRTESGLDPSRYAGFGGGFPLRVGGGLVGAVGVSGLLPSADHDLIVQALREELASL